MQSGFKTKKLLIQNFAIIIFGGENWADGEFYKKAMAHSAQDDLDAWSKLEPECSQMHDRTDSTNGSTQINS